MLSVGDKLRALREYNGMSQIELAKIMNKTSSAICKWEINESLPNIHQISELSQIFHVSTDYIIQTELVFCNVDVLYFEDINKIPYKWLLKKVKKDMGESHSLNISNETPIWKCFLINQDEDEEELGIQQNDKILIQQVDTCETGSLIYVYNKKEHRYYIRTFTTYSDGNHWLMCGVVKTPMEWNDNFVLVGKIISIICE